MKTEPQTRAELALLSKLIEPMAVAMLTNIDADGTLMSRPMAPLLMDSHGAVWFFTDLRSAKVERLRVANLSFTDADRATYVSLSGRGEIHNEREHIEQLWTPLAKPWFPEGPESNHLALLKFVPETAEYWDAPHNKMVRVLAMAASMVAGKPIGLGGHESLTGLGSPVAATHVATHAATH